MKRILLQSVLATTVLLVGFGPAARAQDETTDERPAWSKIDNGVKSWFSQFDDYQPGDLLNRSQVEPLLKALGEAGWEVPRATELAQALLPDQHPLVKALNGKNGVRFMRRVSGYELIYDRLDRLTDEQGGVAMINQLTKLPDGHRYAKMKPERGAPDLVDFLPKNRTGKRPTVKDYDEPTGKIYSQSQLIAVLKHLYESDEQ